MYIAIASILGLVSVGGFTLASMLSAFGGRGEQDFRDSIRISSFSLIPVTIWFASPTVLGIIG